MVATDDAQTPSAPTPPPSPPSPPPPPPGVLAPPRPPPPARPPAAEVAAAVESAASSLTEILATQETLDLGTAQEVTAFVSELIGVQAETQGARQETEGAGSASDDEASRATERAAESLNQAVLELARAVTSAAVGKEVVLQSANVNITTEARRAEDLAAKPITCASISTAPVTVHMDPSILQAYVLAPPPHLPPRLAALAADGQWMASIAIAHSSLA